MRPALIKLGGAEPPEWAERVRRGRWTGPPTRPNKRQQNLPARVVQAADGVDELAPLDWRGSADVVSLTGAQAFAVVEPDVVLEPGQMTAYRPLG